ncbi:pseudouridine synthase [Azospirillum picis]|uniref:Pseudouridine synthase n=1 Tax=Azospirillum picis TaxID=488438 RepID=A0ABU0MJ85_9PROT|nr:23S rRNA pseudouridine2605 synthase [Azospirillum picis]MDQ0533434.1 23S rRNA pseudouridine2605 synthase [Azospirillum picis]
MDRSDTAKKSDSAADGGERIAKRLARAGLCSRRDAERWIAEGRVSVNSRVLDSPACVVHPGDIVQVDGKVVPEPEPSRLWRYHKPSGLVTTARDEKGRETVFDRLPEDLPRVVSIGRLDLTTEGLLLLTNDGELARFLELPATGWTRRYRVRVFGEVDEAQLAGLAKGPTIEGVKYGPIEAVLDRVQGRNAWLTVSLKEGKNREIRKVMEALGLQVNRLIRVAYGPFQLGKLEEGAVEEVPKRVVREQIAPFFTAQEPAEPAESATKQRAKARADSEKASSARAGAAGAPAKAPMKAAAKPETKRPPRTAAKRHEAEAARKGEDAAPARRSTLSLSAKAGGKPAAAKPATKSARKPGEAGPKPQGKPAGKPVGKPSGTMSAKPGPKPGPKSIDGAGPRGGRGGKPDGSKAGPAATGGAKPGAKAGGRTERPRADRRR